MNGEQSAQPQQRKAPATEADIQKMLRTKDFYELLGVAKTATDEEIKKQYKRLALKYHPDKLRLPGAQDVFKKIAQAYDCLTNPDKRAHYDRTGTDEPQQQTRYEQRYYEEDFNPNDIFNMFFGNGFFPNQQGNQRRYHYQEREPRQGRNQQQQPQQKNNFAGLLQLLPFLLIMFSGLFGSIFTESPDFSLSSTNSYNIHKRTLVMKADYYVNSSFESKIMEDVDFWPNFEWKVESEYIQTVKGQCQNAQNKKRQYMFQSQQAWSKRDRDYYIQRSNSVDMTYCQILSDLQNQFDLAKYF